MLWWPLATSGNVWYETNNGWRPLWLTKKAFKLHPVSIAQDMRVVIKAGTERSVPCPTQVCLGNLVQTRIKWIQRCNRSESFGFLQVNSTLTAAASVWSKRQGIDLYSVDLLLDYFGTSRCLSFVKGIRWNSGSVSEIADSIFAYFCCILIHFFDAPDFSKVLCLQGHQPWQCRTPVGYHQWDPQWCPCTTEKADRGAPLLPFDILWHPLIYRPCSYISILVQIVLFEYISYIWRHFMVFSYLNEPF